MSKNDLELKCDICVIGGGSGGLSVAAGAAQLGMDVVLIERDKMGGDCLNTGCVPSKALLAAGKNAAFTKDLSAFGITNNKADVDFAAAKKHVDDVIAHIAPHDSVERFEGLGVCVVQGHAAFQSAKVVKVDDKTITARFFVIATGSHAFLPPIKGLDKDKVFTNETIFALQDKPSHLVIIGGGPIGIEMAFAHSQLGCKVTVIDRDSIMPHDDPDLVNRLRHHLQKAGIDFIEHVDIEKIEHDAGNDSYNAKITIIKDLIIHTIDASHVLVAAGRKVNLEGLGLDDAHIAHDNKGIRVDKRLRSTQKHIFAIGDVAGGPQFTHVAGYHAGIIIRNICFRMPAKVDYKSLPWVTYTDPELAHCGLTQAQAVKKLGTDRVTTHQFNLAEIDRAITEHPAVYQEKETAGYLGMIKIVLDKKGNKILGASILAPHAGEMIALWVLVLQKKLKLQDVASMIIPYPTYSELSKRAAGSFFTPQLFSDRTRNVVKWLQKLPFF